MKALERQISYAAFLDQLRSASTRVLLLDYDGTLAPFTVDRSLALPYPNVAERLMRIMETGTRVVLISGANRGIGRAIAERLYREGYTLSLGARQPASLKAVTAKMSASRVFAHSYDAMKKGSAEAWVAATAKRFGRIDALVNNAGTGTPFTVEDKDESALDEMLFSGGELNSKLLGMERTI